MPVKNENVDMLPDWAELVVVVADVNRMFDSFQLETEYSWALYWQPATRPVTVTTNTNKHYSQELAPDIFR